MSLVVVFGRQRHRRGAAGAPTAGNRSVARRDARPRLRRPRPCDTRGIPHRSPRGPMPAARPTPR
ncbi:glycosyl transferase, family 3 [Burkholderia stabilis]|nr:glycosyl transferase, family 3 [Burkholderia stabilis]